MVDFLNTNQKILVALLSASISQEPCDLEIDDDIDWLTVISEAFKHQVFTLIYKPLVDLSGKINIPCEILERLKFEVINEVKTQESNYLAIGIVLKHIIDDNIHVIVLKGLVLRELYPEPGLRTMCDFDLLIKKAEMEKAENVLRNLGYKKIDDKEKHAVFTHDYLPSIELHRQMVSKNVFPCYEAFEEHVWEYAEPVDISGVQVLSLCPVDKVTYQIIHMASHLLNDGFGLRQLIDLVLLVDDSRYDINWSEFFRVAETLNIGTFSKALFQLCGRLFDLNLQNTGLLYDEKFEINQCLVDEIFEGGVFGKNENGYIVANRIIYYNEGIKADNCIERIMSFIIFLFPSADKLDNKFSYAKKHHYLLPVAWVYRILSNLWRKDISLNDKISVVKPAKLMNISSKRSKMLKQLGLLRLGIEDK